MPKPIYIPGTRKQKRGNEQVGSIYNARYILCTSHKAQVRGDRLLESKERKWRKSGKKLEVGIAPIGDERHCRVRGAVIMIL